MLTRAYYSHARYKTVTRAAMKTRAMSQHEERDANA
jgi:hypothetical protein